MSCMHVLFSEVTCVVPRGLERPGLLAGTLCLAAPVDTGYFVHPNSMVASQMML